MSKASIRRRPIHLNPVHRESDVLVQDGDDLFLLTVQDAVNACGAWNKMAEFQSQMKELKARLEQWVSARETTVRDAFLSVKTGGGLFFMVVMNERKFDRDLEDDLTDLDVEIANAPEFNLLRMSVLALPNSPPDSVESFLTNL